MTAIEIETGTTTGIETEAGATMATATAMTVDITIATMTAGLIMIADTIGTTAVGMAIDGSAGMDIAGSIKN
jgi:hypothetical protein